MARDRWRAFAELIERKDIAGIVEALEALDEPERTRLSMRAQKEARALAGLDRNDFGAADWKDARERRDTAEGVVFGTAGAAAAARSRWFPWERPELRDRAIRSRPRSWRQDWAERVMEESDVRIEDWRTVRELVKAGLIDRPQAPGYITGAVSGMKDDERDSETRRRLTPLVDVLRAEPDWLRDDLWRLFEVEDAALSSRDGWEHDRQHSWRSALCELTADGIVPRSRLLDESLAALRRDFSPHNARWYHKLYEALDPTPEEHLERIDVLLALLAADDPALVAFALRALGVVERGGRLPPADLFEAIPPALLLPVKGHATRAIKLAARVLKREPDAARLAAPALVEALAHESRDVQEAAIDVLEHHSDALSEQDRTRIGGLAADVDVALRARTTALGAIMATAADEAGTVDPAVRVPGRQPVARDTPRLAGAQPLVPPADVGELLDRMAIALERRDDPDELELMLDGVSRLRAGDVNPGRARALVGRCLALSLPWRGGVGFGHARNAVAVVILRWLGGAEHRKIRLEWTGRSPREAIAMRVRELLDELPGGSPRALLSTPTHSGGWIVPPVAVARVAALDGRRPPVMDMAQMVLRLAPDGRDEARSAAEQLDGEAGAVLARALGGAPRRPRLARLARLKAAWAAAEHARDPDAFTPPERRLDDSDAMRMSWGLGVDRSVKVDPASPADLLVLEESWWDFEQEGGIERWLTTVWPANREAVYQIVARRLWINRGTREYGIGDVLETLLHPLEPIGRHAALALALGLGAADVADRVLAVDATIAALESRRLDGEALGATLALLLREQDAAVPARWAASLTDVAAAGPLASHDVQTATERVIAAANDDDRRRLLGLVELLRRVAVEAGARVCDENARRWLGTLGSSSKTGRAATEALAVHGDGAARSRAAVAALG